MRRVLLIAVLVATAAAGVVAAGGDDGDDDYELDAIFDNVAFLTEGQQVRVAGANVGRVEALGITPDHKARVTLVIDERFAPFRADADCTIQPQSLIGERFVECTPGTPNAPPLPMEDGRATLPVSNTHAPVDLDLILGTFDRPARDRLGILLGSLGAGLAGRGKDLNAAIRRANPALQEARRVLEILDRDRSRLRQLVADADTVLRQLSRRGRRVGAFVRHAAEVTSATGRRRGRVAEAARRLPALLGRAEPALRELASFARAGTPLMADLERSGPGVAALLRRSEPFAASLRGTLDDLAPVLGRTRRALPDVTPQVSRLQRFAAEASPVSGLVEDLGTSLRDQGAIDGFGAFFYYATAALSRFDRLSHILPAHPLASVCAAYARTPQPGCSAKYASSAGTAARRRPATAERKPEPARRPRAESANDLLLEFLLR